MKMPRAQKLLLTWSVALVALAEIIKRLPMSEKATIIVGLSEITLAVATGIAFGLAPNRDNH